jgi:hypothetical protein
MSDKGRFDKLNRTRCDFLVNADDKLISHNIKIVIKNEN